MNETEIVLASVFLLSNVFWAYQCQSLINKLMSRNYHEFKVADLQKTEKEKKIKRDPSFNTDEMGQLDELM
jgi:hypothetical protein